MSEVVIESHDNEDPPHLVVHPFGNIDAYSATAFRESLAALADDQNLVIVLNDVPFMDSAGLGALIGVLRGLREKNGKTVVVCDKPPVLRLLHTTGFDRIVAISQSYDDALEMLRDPDSEL